MKTYRKISIVCFQLLLVLGLLFGTQTTVKADQFDEGIAAYEAGNFQKAFEKFKPLAKKGDSWAQFQLGIIYGWGKGVPRDDREAAKWYRKAAKWGHPIALLNLGHMYGKGQGVPQDYVQAYKWFNIIASHFYGKYHEEAVRNRNVIKKRMTPAQVAEALKLAIEWKGVYCQGCPVRRTCLSQRKLSQRKCFPLPIPIPREIP